MCRMQSYEINEIVANHNKIPWDCVQVLIPQEPNEEANLWMAS
jgi:hypothetical protein